MTSGNSETLKPSQYNTFVYHEEDQAHIGFNSVSGGVMVFSAGQIEVVNEILADPNCELDEEREEMRRSLLEARFLVESRANELKMLKVRHLMSKQGNQELGLVVAPTLACNFDCPYCYVDRGKISMDAEAIVRFKNFISKKAENIKKIRVCWTGGEPLLALDIIGDLTRFMEAECKPRNIKLTCTMVSNGFLLHGDNIKKLKSLGIHAVQVTLDGNRESHNRSRYTPGGGETYDRILENVIDASNKGLSVTLRSNISKENIGGVYKMLDELSDKKFNADFLKFSPSKILPSELSGDLCHLFNPMEYAALEPNLVEYALKKGIRSNILDMHTIAVYCCANWMSTYVIDPYTNVMKCWCNLGDCKNNKIGALAADGELAIDFPSLSEWAAWDAFDIPECRECQVLPLCMGGCKYYNDTGRSDLRGDGCSHRKHNLKEMLILYYLSLTKYKPGYSPQHFKKK